MHSDPAAAHVFSCYDDEVCADDCATNPRVQTRGILWVLRWAAALAVLSFSCGVLAEFAFCLAAEHTVNRAVLPVHWRPRSPGRHQKASPNLSCNGSPATLAPADKRGS